MISPLFILSIIIHKDIGIHLVLNLRKSFGLYLLLGYLNKSGMRFLCHFQNLNTLKAKLKEITKRLAVWKNLKLKEKLASANNFFFLSY